MEGLGAGEGEGERWRAWVQGRERGSNGGGRRMDFSSSACEESSEGQHGGGGTQVASLGSPYPSQALFLNMLPENDTHILPHSHTTDSFTPTPPHPTLNEPWSLSTSVAPMAFRYATMRSQEAAPSAPVSSQSFG